MLIVTGGAACMGTNLVQEEHIFAGHRLCDCFEVEWLEGHAPNRGTAVDDRPEVSQ